MGGPGINPQQRQRYGSRRGRRSNSGFTNVTSLKRMAKRFKSAATSKIQERAGLQPGPGSNLASQMASAFMTVGANLPSAEPSPTLDPSNLHLICVIFWKGLLYYLERTITITNNLM